MLVANRYFGRSWSKSFISLDIIMFLAIAALVFIAHFWYFRSLGLYEDDLWRIPYTMSASFSQMWVILAKIFLFVDGQGRPFHDGLIEIFAFIGSRLGGLAAIYVIAYLIVAANSLIFYLLLKRIFPHPIFTITGAFAFVLFPADTTQSFLTHSLGLQPSLFFILLAFHLYLAGKKNLSYLPLLACLLCYETPYPIFLTAPLFNQKWDLKLRKDFLKHIFIMAIMVIGIVVLRKLTGEERAGNLDLLTAIRTPLYQMLIGPIVCLKMFFRRSFETFLLLNDNRKLLFGIIPSFVGLTWLFVTRIKFDRLDHPTNLVHRLNSLDERLNIPEILRPLPKITLISLGMLILAYPLTFTVPATEISGRASRVHFGAILGASILFACICTVTFYYARKYRLKNLFGVVLAFYFSLLIGFGLTVQKDYQLAWQYQKSFWRDLVLNLSPDITEKTIILIEPNTLPWGKQINPFDWSLYSIIDQLYELPYGVLPSPYPFLIPPRVNKLKSNWQTKILDQAKTKFKINRQIDVVDYYPSWLPTTIVDSSNVIFLEKKNDQLVRRSEPLIINGQEFPLKKKASSTLANYPRRPLYNLLIESPLDRNINYLAPVDKSQAEEVRKLALGLIDNLEGNDGGNALGGGWFTYDDKANGGDSVVSPAPGNFAPSGEGANGSTRAAKMTGKVTKTYPYSNIAMGTTLGKNPIDISKYKGIEFWAKGDGKKFQLQLQTPLIKDFNFYNYVFTAQPEWTRYEVLFDQIKQEDWGKKTVAVPKSDALTKINSIVWRTYPIGQSRENVELVIDDVKFIK